MRLAPAEREFLPAAGVYFGGGRKAQNPRIHPYPPICAREYLFRRRNQAAFDGRIPPSGRGRKGIHRHPHLQDKSQIPRGILDRHGRLLPWLETQTTPLTVDAWSGKCGADETFTAFRSSLRRNGTPIHL